jgi:4'-phosphopantetheinyl transferase
MQTIRDSGGAAPIAPLRRDEAHVWYAWTEQCAKEGLLDVYSTLLDDFERERLRRLAFEHLRVEYLVTRALCRLTLSRYAPIAPAAWAFRCNAYGRPEIDVPGAPQGLRFNMSNVRSMVACVVTLDADAGIDVEETDRSGETLSIANHYFAPSEVRDLSALPESDRRRRFFEYWTLKESYIKARGMGLSIPLEQFAFAIDDGSIRISLDSRLGDNEAQWQFALRAPSERHLLAVGVLRAGSGHVQLHVNEVLPQPGMPWIGVACDC